MAEAAKNSPGEPLEARAGCPQADNKKDHGQDVEDAEGRQHPGGEWFLAWQGRRDGTGAPVRAVSPMASKGMSGIAQAIARQA